jgi:hypothetical protein
VLSLALEPEPEPEPRASPPPPVVVAEAPVRDLPPVQLAVSAPVRLPVSTPDRPERDALLGRLRARAKALDASDVQRILDQKKRRPA